MQKNKDWIKYSNLGFQIITTLALFGGIGYFLDNLYSDYKPFFLISSLFLPSFSSDCASITLSSSSAER